VHAEKKKRDGVGVVDAGARPQGSRTLVAASRAEFVEEVWAAWGLAATSAKML
jgi:hypothetical protein